MKEITIGKNEAGQRLDKFLGKYLDKAPKSFLYKMMRKKNITLNGKKAAGNEPLALGDTVRFFLADDTIAKFSTGGEDVPLPDQRKLDGWKPDILYEDEHTIFMNKPVGMLSQKAKKDDVSMVEYLTGHLLRSGEITKEELATFHPAVCNRLDRNTSGIVAAGKTLAALQELGGMFRDRTIRKYYLCLVRGEDVQPEHIRAYLRKDHRTNRVTVTDKKTDTDSSLIETEYRPIASAGGVTLIEVHLITGKTHQIRAHLAWKGHPLAGDYKYGDRTFNDELKKQYGLSSQLLHAYRLCMPECTGELSAISGMELTAPVPDLFRKICCDKGVM